VNSLILRTSSRILTPMMVAFSIVLLLRGHNAPGGGFVGGLVAAAAFALRAIAFDVHAARKSFRLEPHAVVGAGLSVALAAGLFPILFGEPFLKGLWTEGKIPVLGAVGTPLFFDIGVYLTVLGTTMLILLSIKEE